MEKLTGTPRTKWSNETTLETEIYNSWCDLVSCELNERYRIFSESRLLPRSVEMTKRFKIFGKDYTSQFIRGGEGNSSIEYYTQGQHQFGHIQYAFRTHKIPAIFFVVQPFKMLNVEDSARNFYLAHPGLHATIVYSETGSSVVIDSRDLIGHCVFFSNPPGHLGIQSKTQSVVSLRNIVSSLHLLLL